MRIYSATDVGQKRKMNQDYVFASEGPVGNLPNLFTVADGMGGHNAGDYASSHAVRILVDEIREDADYNPVKVIRHAIEAANTEIRNRAQEDENLRGMGTTMVFSPRICENRIAQKAIAIMPRITEPRTAGSARSIAEK